MLASEPDVLTIDFMLLADKAEALNGKLYMVGGAWDRIAVPQFPSQPVEPFSVAIGIYVPWNMTNRRFKFGLELTDADGEAVGDALQTELEAGRPPGLRQGTPQRVVLTVGAAPEFPHEGRYAWYASIDGERLGHVAFEVQTAMPISGAVQT